MEENIKYLVDYYLSRNYKIDLFPINKVWTLLVHNPSELYTIRFVFKSNEIHIKVFLHIVNADRIYEKFGILESLEENKEVVIHKLHDWKYQSVNKITPNEAMQNAIDNEIFYNMYMKRFFNVTI